MGRVLELIFSSEDKKLSMEDVQNVCISFFKKEKELIDHLGISI